MEDIFTMVFVLFIKLIRESRSPFSLLQFSVLALMYFYRKIEV